MLFRLPINDTVNAAARVLCSRPPPTLAQKIGEVEAAVFPLVGIELPCVRRHAQASPKQEKWGHREAVHPLPASGEGLLPIGSQKGREGVAELNTQGRGCGHDTQSQNDGLGACRAPVAGAGPARRLLPGRCYPVW